MNGWNRGSLLLIGLAFLGPRLVHAQEAAEVTCKDGTTSHGGKGACSGHGGVDKSASKAAAQPAEKATTSSKSKSTSSEATGSAAAAPASAAAAEVTCKDGTTSHGGKGACSGHGGVDKTASTAAGESNPKKATRSPTSWGESSSSATAPAASAAAPASVADAEVICKDGTTSHGGKGACSGHGGVDKSASASKHTGTSAAAPTSAAASGMGGSAAPPAESAPARTAAPAAAAAAPAAATPTSPGSAAGQKGPPTAKCKDGSLSYAQHHSGACSDHGGVAQWLDGTQK